MRKRLFLLKLLIYVLLIMIIPQDTFAQETQSDLLKNALKKLFSPKEMEFYAENPSECYFERIYIRAKNALVSGLPLESVEIEARHVALNPPEEWGSGKIKVKKADEVKLMMVVTEENLNSFLQERISKGKEDNLKKASVKIKEDLLYVIGSYQLDGFPLRILVELKSKLDLEGSQIILKDYKLHIGGLGTSEDFAERLIAKINPVFDLSKLPFPIDKAQLEQSEGKIVIKTSELPQPPSLNLIGRDNPNTSHVGN